ncbi:glutaminase domain-containing protein [uncultured Bacteroides sp.]|uniref:glutaminase family protein n=1 Tax=uncultured Bacteroides sp. TaxID=162156 RepID=UPI002AAB43ED|nr:DUF4965 domain-containing protein [uncultured Bacteroides sp.]
MKKLSVLLLAVYAAFFCAGISAANNFRSEKKSSLRSPAYPLVTVDPYFSAWQFSNELYKEPVRHWTGKEHPIIGALRVDGKSYRFMGVESLPLKVILPTASTEKWDAEYTFSEPKGAWTNLNYKAVNWQKGKSAFGTPEQSHLSTEWLTKDIWVRRVFNLSDDLKNQEAYLNYSHDDIFELYINGTKVVSTGYSWKNNVLLKLSDKVKATLKKGENIIVAHCHNQEGGAYLDFGLFEKEKNVETFTTAAVQKSAIVLPTQTFYTFECGPIKLSLIFTAPLLMDDLDLMTRPINYITYQVKATDNKLHDVQIYFDTTPQWAVNEDSQKVDFEKIDNKNGISYLKTGTIEQPVLQKKGDDLRIDWGYFYLASKTDKSTTLSFGDYSLLKKEFAAKGKISSSAATLSPDMKKKMTVLTYSRNLGKISSTSNNGFLMLGYDDLYSIQYYKNNLMPYWKHNGTVNIYQEFEKANSDYISIMKRCEKFNTEMMNDAAKSGGEKYADLCALAYRQAIAAHKLVQDKDGNLLFFSKENFSNGSIGTVDVTYPSAPLFLVYNLDLLKGMLNPIFYYSESGKWTKPFAAHDVGTYPQANGQTYGGDMPVEESGNMLILTTAIAKAEGNANYARKHWDVLTIWADYLIGEGLDPANQLCTDDFAGHFAHNANLSIKAIMGIAGYGILADMLGKKDVAEKYLSAAKKMAVKWEKMANDGDHYKLTFDQAGTWSQKYNLVWDKMFGLNIFSYDIAKKEVAYYLTKQNSYGLPLDSRKTYTKSDWIMWTALLTDTQQDFDALIDPIYKYANQTTTRMPLSDWHETTDGNSVGFRSRSVVGGYFMKMLDAKLGVKK